MWLKFSTSASTSSSSSSSFSTAERELPMWNCINKARSSLNVEEEYNKALRTKSFIDICAKAHRHHTATAQSPEIRTYYARLPDCLLNPSQESLLLADKSYFGTHRRTHHLLLLDYFNATLGACNACAALLDCIDRARTHRRSLAHLLLRLGTHHRDRSTVLASLASHANAGSPFSQSSLAQFHRAHASCGLLLRRLSDARHRGWRLLKAIEMALGWHQSWVEAAARGAYIVGREMETVGMMVRRVGDEVEHGREVAMMVVRNGGEVQMAREVAREMEGEDQLFREQVAELEEHVCLCLLAINRCRGLVAAALCHS